MAKCLLIVLGLIVPHAASGVELPRCDQLLIEPSDSELEQAAIQAISEFAEPWGDDFGAAFRRMSNIIGCEVPPAEIFSSGFESGSFIDWSEAELFMTTTSSSSIVGSCQRFFCPDVLYCGRGDSQTHPRDFHVPFTSIDMNINCFAHDNCYRKTCVHGDCWFAGVGTQSSKCDAEFFFFCDTILTKLLHDRMTCIFARHLAPIKPRTVACSQPPCSGLMGDVCLADKGECGQSVRTLTCSVIIGSRLCDLDQMCHGMSTPDCNGGSAICICGVASCLDNANDCHL